VLRRLKTSTQQGKILFAHRDFIAQPRDQRVLAVLQVIPIMAVALLRRHLRAQPPKLLIVLTTLFAHTRSIDSTRFGFLSHRVASPARLSISAGGLGARRRGRATGTRAALAGSHSGGDGEVSRSPVSADAEPAAAKLRTRPGSVTRIRTRTTLACRPLRAWAAPPSTRSH
jgi:hypothetical protein